MGVGQESFGVENTRLNTIVGVVLDVLQIYADDVLGVDVRGYFVLCVITSGCTYPSRVPVTSNHLAFWRDNSREIDRRGVMDA